MAVNTSKIVAKEILNDINNKKIILYERDKNRQFIKKYSISKDEIDEIIYSLTDNHFIERIENKDSKIKSKYLYIFNVLYEFTNESGECLIKLFIKIGEIEDGVLLVSFHEINDY